MAPPIQYRLIEKVDYKSWPKKLDRSGNRWLKRVQLLDKLWYNIVPIGLDPSRDRLRDFMTLQKEFLIVLNWFFLFTATKVRKSGTFYVSTSRQSTRSITT